MTLRHKQACAACARVRVHSVSHQRVSLTRENEREPRETQHALRCNLNKKAYPLVPTPSGGRGSYHPMLWSLLMLARWWERVGHNTFARPVRKCRVFNQTLARQNIFFNLSRQKPTQI